MPISPSTPVSVTISTSSEKALPSGVTISSFRMSAMFAPCPQSGLTSPIPPFM